MRKYGWELPYHSLQVVAIAVFLARAFAFYVFLVLFVGAKAFQYTLIGLFSFPTPLCQPPRNISRHPKWRGLLPFMVPYYDLVWSMTWPQEGLKHNTKKNLL